MLAPGWLALGVGVAAVLVALHAITVGRPRPAWLPTARFAPDRAPRAERRLARPADQRLLAIRVLAALLAALALARPVREPERRRVARLVLADVSDAATHTAVVDRVRGLAGAGDVVVAFAAAPRPPLVLGGVPRTSTDTVTRRASLDSALAPSAADSGVPASLSAALVAARRAAPALAAGADSLELVVVSPFPREAADAATLAVRGVWAGRARLLSVGDAGAAARVPDGRGGVAPRATVAAPAAARVALRGGPADDALAAALALAGVARDDAAPVRVVRGVAADADRAWAMGAGHALVVWPATAGVGAPGGGAAGASPGAEAFAADGWAVVGAFGRRAVGDSAARLGRVLARWADGGAAAVERATGRGCVRTVGVSVPQVGDAALRPGFVALLPALLGPCGAPRDRAALAAADLSRLAGVGPLLAAAPLRAVRSVRARDPLGAALLALAAALLLAELPLRRLWRTGREEQVAGSHLDEARAIDAALNASSTRRAA